MLEGLKKAVSRFVDAVSEATGRGVVIKEEHIEGPLEELELNLIKSDTAVEVVEKIVEELKNELVGKKVEKREDIKQEIKEVLIKILSKEAPDIFIDKKPVILLFVGPNGVGKTATIGKFAKYLRDKGKTVVIAASDTFRPGSIEQLEELAKKCGARVVKHDYGADPAAVAYDAVASAKAKGADFVLIDTAGRQDTNEALIEQLKKIKRVVGPDFTVFVGEATSGNALYRQVKTFSEEVGVDFAVLTKMDLDVKGGGTFSIVLSGVPVAYICYGQELDSFKKFSPEEVVERIL